MRTPLDDLRAILAEDTVYAAERDSAFRRYIRARVPVNRRYTVLAAHRADHPMAEYMTVSRPLWDAILAVVQEDPHA